MAQKGGQHTNGRRRCIESSCDERISTTSGPLVVARPAGAAWAGRAFADDEHPHGAGPFDMAGNVWEWFEHEVAGTGLYGPGRVESRRWTMRYGGFMGGSFRTPAHALAERITWDHATDTVEANTGLDDVGFRLALSARPARRI